MSDYPSSPIPDKLRNDGYSVFIERMSRGQGPRLWCASASRDGSKWSAFGEELGAVLLELDRQIHEEDGDWRETIADEMHETARDRLHSHSTVHSPGKASSRILPATPVDRVQSGTIALTSTVQL